MRYRKQACFVISVHFMLPVTCSMVATASSASLFVPTIASDALPVNKKTFASELVASISVWLRLPFCSGLSSAQNKQGELCLFRNACLPVLRWCTSHDRNQSKHGIRVLHVF